MSVRRILGWAAVVCCAGLAWVVSAEDLVITALAGNGSMTWTYPTNGVREYRIEWASDLTLGDWTDLEQGLRSIAPTGGVLTARVPMFYRVKALGPAPTNMVYIPAGRFSMGDGLSEGDVDERPAHTVYVGAFYMDRYEVTGSLWSNVYQWATNHGYGFDHAGSVKATNHPVHTVSWFDAVKWCNARSQKEGRPPVFYTDAGLTQVYASGQVAPYVDETAAGYRLPTEAEWEKAARGAVAGYRFPWSDGETIQHARANYFSTNTYSYDTSPTRGYHPEADDGIAPYTRPVGSFSPNGYGLYDMAGNVWEWCWDWYSSGYYGSSPEVNPRGADTGTYRVRRSGGCASVAGYCRVSYRYVYAPDSVYDNLGFRSVLSPGP